MSTQAVPGSGAVGDLAGLLSAENGAWVESLYEDYVLGRASVPARWREIFDALASGDGARRSPAPRISAGEERILPGLGTFALVDAYRSHGHLIARLDPLGRGATEHALLDPGGFGLEDRHMDVIGPCGNYLGLREATPRALISHLRATYCGTFAAEFMEIRDKQRRDWLLERMEPFQNAPELSGEARQRILSQVIAVERLEQFLHKRFIGQKRFSIEGAETLIPLMDTIVEDAAELGALELVIAMAHRGRLNVMTHVIGMPYRALMAGFQSGLVPLSVQGSGDVKYHRGYSADRKTRSGRTIHLSLQPNPSHLEWVNPVAEGITRAKQNFRGDVERAQVIPVMIHGDSAFIGQGIVPETLAMSELDIYWTGGTIHIIVNNQIAYTTEPEDYRFTQHPSDMAKVIQAPIFHVNADDPEACVHAARLAIEFRQRWKEDVIIDLVCYRRHGHNEGDDPTFTQPLLYRQINAHPRVGTLYTERLLQERTIDQAATDKLEREQNRRLEQALDESTQQLRDAGTEGYHGLWSGLESRERVELPTAVPRDRLNRVAEALLDMPEGFSAHPKIKRLMEQRSRAIIEGEAIDWGTAEALALGTMLLEGTTIRLTGQDAERGTFSSRHAVLHDVQTGARHIPLDGLTSKGSRLIIHNSNLSEAAVLGFEYGYSSVDPDRLALWEAQFGDFCNTAQVIIDQFIASAETKWTRSSGLVMLLPHGYEGQGPEHSSARLERFLQLCAEDNMQVCSLTTPAQYFHGLRRQIRRNYRKPLVLMSPKSLLRHPRAVSPVDEFSDGGFRCVIDDPSFASGELAREAVRRVIVCSGKVYYTLLAAREDTAFNDVALLRLEQLHPFPFAELGETLAAYPAHDIVWCQEEPWNMGAWTYVQERLRGILSGGDTLRYVGRKEAASPAAGSYTLHESEEAELVREAFARTSRERVS
ncbi:MAG: 2-oxoglutarate dehydrogenase E1 component [Myxococcota bacterium]